jgi:hypothetical protein
MSPLKKLARLRKALKHADRKSVPRILFEYLKFRLTRPELAEQYFTKFMFRQSVTNPSDYIVTRKLSKQIWYYNDMRYNRIFTHKYNFENFLSRYNVPVIKSFAHNDNHLFFIGNEIKLINTIDKFRHLFIELKANNLWKENFMIVKKKEDSYGGRNIYKISINDVSENKAIIESLYADIVESGYLYQDNIVQHPELNRVNPHSVNTIRIDTFTNKQGTTGILNAALRFSCNTSFIDNVSSGGMFVGMDLNTGTLRAEAFSDFDIGSGEILLSHPLTGLVFKDFKIPFYNQAVQMVTRAAALLPHARVIGWDVGITPDGPVIIEGNFFNNLFNMELVQQGHSKNPVFRQLLDEVADYYAGQEDKLDKLIRKYPLWS